MIFYTINRGSKPDLIVDWAGTQAEAKAACKALPVTGIDFAEWKEHDVPTDKPSLLAWLKKHAVSLGERQVELIAEMLHLPETNPQIMRQGPHQMWNPPKPE